MAVIDPIDFAGSLGRRLRPADPARRGLDGEAEIQPLSRLRPIPSRAAASRTEWADSDLARRANSQRRPHRVLLTLRRELSNCIEAMWYAYSPPTRRLGQQMLRFILETPLVVPVFPMRARGAI